MFVSVFNITNVFNNVLFSITMEAFLLYEIISGIGNFLYFRFKGNDVLIAGLGKKFIAVIYPQTQHKKASHVYNFDKKKETLSLCYGQNQITWSRMFKRWTPLSTG